jgi:hypothetical protein
VLEIELGSTKGVDDDEIQQGVPGSGREMITRFCVTEGLYL